MYEPIKDELLYAYVAGIVDGEGSIIIEKRKSKKRGRWYSLSVQVGTTNEWLPRFLKLAFPQSYIYGPYKSKSLPNSKPSWRWQIVCKQAAILLIKILPYLQIKRQQAELALNFQSRRGNTMYHQKNGKFAPSSQKSVLDEAQKILMGKYNQRGLIKEETK